eukprot:g61427.t1
MGHDVDLHEWEEQGAEDAKLPSVLWWLETEGSASLRSRLRTRLGWCIPSRQHEHNMLLNWRRLTVSPPAIMIQHNRFLILLLQSKRLLLSTVGEKKPRVPPHINCA